MRNTVFHFKRFEVDQAGCAMKINTDGILLAAIAAGDDPRMILDIGTGTGAMALMMAQRYPDAQVDAVEIDLQAAGTASVNIKRSPFATRMRIFPLSFQEYFHSAGVEKYDLIISNPPFFLNSLQSDNGRKMLARHADPLFFKELFTNAAVNLSPAGRLWLILPVETAFTVASTAADAGMYPEETVFIRSFPDSAPHRVIISYLLLPVSTPETGLFIYEKQHEYSPRYRELLKDFLLIF